MQKKSREIISLRGVLRSGGLTNVYMVQGPNISFTDRCRTHIHTPCVYFYVNALSVCLTEFNHLKSIYNVYNIL